MILRTGIASVFEDFVQRLQFLGSTLVLLGTSEEQTPQEQLLGFFFEGRLTLNPRDSHKVI